MEPLVASNTERLESLSIFFDIETTGLKPRQRVEPLQIAARAVLGDKVRIFSKYMIPCGSIEAQSSLVHHLFKEDGHLVKMVDGVKEVVEDAVSVQTGLELFWVWVDEMGRLIPEKEVYMVCYSYNKFDIEVLKHSMREKTSIPASLQGRLVESEPMDGFQKKLGVKARRLGDVVKEVLGENYQYGAHNATEDAKALHQFVNELAKKNNLTLTSVLAMDTRKKLFEL